MKQVQYPSRSEVSTQQRVKAPSKNIVYMQPDEPYNEVLDFPENRKLALFKNKDCQYPVFIGLDTPRKRSMVCILNTGMDLDQTWPAVLHLNRLASIHQRDITNMHSASHTKLKVSGTITLHFRNGEPCTRVNFNAVGKIVVSALLGWLISTCQ